MTRVEGEALEPTLIVKAPWLGPPPGRFVFSDLEKVSRAEARLATWLQALFSPWAANEGPCEAVTNRLRALFDVRTELRPDRLRVVRPRELRRYVAAPTFLAVVAPPSRERRGFIEVELSLAHAAVEILLGGPGDPVPLRPLTEIEEGVMCYVVLEVLRALASHLEPNVPRLRLDGVARKIDPCLLQFGGDSQVAIVLFRCSLGAHEGFARMILPASMLEMTVPEPFASGEHAQERRRARIVQHGPLLASINTWLRVEIGSVEVGVADLAGLTPGDVVLIGEPSVRSDRGDPGTAELRVGAGRAGGFVADVALDRDQYVATITSFRAHAHENAQAEPYEVQMKELSKEGAELLGDIPLHIAVELGRVPLTAEQVVTLHAGQVVELNRGPGEPVDLSVNGRVIARGELVEVEDQLGVRILSIG